MAALRSLVLALIAGAALGVPGQVAPPQLDVAGLIDELLARPAARRALWGVLVHDLETGETVYERNKDRLFIPASNVKLFSTALALRRLGADYRFATVLAIDGTVDENGILEGDLRLVGGGDPNLSSRLLPFRKKEDYGADRLAPLRQLARRVVESGIRRIAGDVIGDDSRYVWQPYPRGWSHADTLQGYGSPTSALVFNDNLIQVLVRPGATGGPARLRVVPDLGFYELANRTLTLAGRHVARGLQARRGTGNGEVILAGQIPSRSRGRRFLFAADDPAHYAAVALRKALEEAGIQIDGRARAHHLLPDGLISLRSPPPSRRSRSSTTIAESPSSGLREAIRVVNKESQNLHAEMLMREVALQEAGIGSREAAVASMRRFLADAGIGSGAFFLRDGSGLSRHNLVAPSATVRLLEYMWETADRAAFVDSLPVAGLDGTLDWRFRRTAARGQIHAKTGSMSHVLALSGYARTGGGRTLAFAIFANNFGLASSSTRHLVDSIASALVRHGAS